jgi:CheY-like chemotaxis protein
MAVNEFKYRARLVKEYGDLPTIMANDGRLSQVFLNLLVNAAQSIVDGGVERNEIRIRSWAEGDEVLVEISDTGRGMPPEEVARVFEPFYSTKPEGVGSGLGLSICDNIIRSYGGRIDVRSEPGTGTRFTVRLPQSSSGDYEAVEPAPAAEEKPEQPEVRHGRILMIDDEPNFGTSIQRVLMDEFEVVVATSGAAGKEILEQDTGFGLILCDLLMPTVSGMDLYDWLETRSPELASRVVFVTGGAFTPQARSFLQRVPNLHLEKPFDVSYIRSLLRELLARRTAGPG